MAEHEFLVGSSYTVADIGLYAYTHAAGDGEIDLEPLPAVRAWLARVESQPGFVNDLEPYPPGALVGAGGASVHDRPPS